MGNICLDAARNYLACGLSIIPVRPDNKKPYIKWEEFQRRRATSEEISGWWTQWPSAMVGIVTGEISRIIVLDADTDEATQEIEQEIPEGLITPIAQSPHGKHYYFQYQQGVRNYNGDGSVKFHVRAEGGYIIASPSVNGTGKPYAWLPGLSIAEVTPPPLPDAFIKIIKSNYKGGEVNSFLSDFKQPELTSTDSKMFIEGRRDEDLFHAANCLVKGNAEPPFITKILEMLAKSCIPPFPEKELSTKIESALKRAAHREINFAQEVFEFVLTSNGLFLTSDVLNRLQVTSRQEKKNVTNALLRLKEKGIIERVGEKDGCYRRVENQAEEVNFLNAPTEDFPITWPLGIQNICMIYPGNIIIVAGSKGAGKTAFLLNTVKLNQDWHEIIYLNSEMGDTEFRKRLELFEGMKLTDWRFKAYHRTNNFEDLITREKKIFIIDFLEVTSDFWMVAKYLQNIHNKLKEGIAIVALQKSEMKEMGRGGDFSKEKARLYLSLDYLPDGKQNRLKIVDAKSWKTNQNPRGMYRHYKLVNGSKFLPEGSWLE